MATSCGFESHRPHQPSLARERRLPRRSRQAKAGRRRELRLGKPRRKTVRTSRPKGAPLQPIGPFEMRRLEALSNTIFGVAMTLLAYDLPKASRFAKAPAWIDLVNAYAQPVIALMISFIIAGVFWLSHH